MKKKKKERSRGEDEKRNTHNNNNNVIIIVRIYIMGVSRGSFLRYCSYIRTESARPHHHVYYIYNTHVVIISAAKRRLIEYLSGLNPNPGIIIMYTISSRNRSIFFSR